MEQDQTVIEGIIRNEDLFELSLSDTEINGLLDQRIKDAENHWYADKDWDLKTVYKNNRKLWLPRHLEDQEMYRHEVPYQDPRIFIDVETLVSQANSRVANPEASPGSEAPASIQFAKDLEGVIVAWCRDHKMKLLQRQVTRGLMVNRHAYACLRYDEEFGTNGDIIGEYVSGKDVLPDPDAKMGEQPRYFFRNRRATVQELIDQFPAKKDEIFKELGIQRGTNSQLGKVYGFRECWFFYKDEVEKRKCLALVYKLNKVVLDKIKNPNWRQTGKNYLPTEVIPYIPMNFLNLGDSYIDDTTLIEQARSVQELLDKRGKQAAEATDQATGGLIFNSSMISKKEGMKLTGHPKEKIFVNGDVRSAVVRLAPGDVSPGIIADKADARTSIDNIFGTHAPTRGEASGNPTFGQDQLQTQKDLTRNDELIRAIDQWFHDFYNLLVQMMCVWYDDAHWFDIKNDDGKFDRIAMQSDDIDQGCKVYVEPGSTLPIDKQAMQQTGLALAKMQLIDPLSLFEDLGLPNATKRFSRLIAWLTNPQSMVQDAEDEDFDRKAFMDLTVLLSGNEPAVRNDISERYLQFFSNFIKGGEWIDLEEKKNGKKIQKAIADYVAKETAILQRMLQLQEQTLPTPDQMTTGNQQAVTQAQQAGTIAANTPQDPAAAAMASAQGAQPIPSAGTPSPGNSGQQPIFNNANLAAYAKQMPEVKTQTSAGA